MNEYEKYCKYDLGNTTVNILSIDELLKICEIDRKAFWQNLSSKKLGYGDIKGSDDLKQGISSLYQHINLEDILPTAGAAGANHLVFYSLIEPEDNVISVIPTYQQLYSIPASFKADVKLLHLKKENAPQKIKSQNNRKYAHKESLSWRFGGGDYCNRNSKQHIYCAPCNRKNPSFWRCDRLA